jgi:hypothetical protein
MSIDDFAQSAPGGSGEVIIIGFFVILGLIVIYTTLNAFGMN